MYPQGPLVCDICGHCFKHIRIIHLVAKEGYTRIILQGQCHNEKAHEVIPHLVKISTKAEGILSHDAQGEGWNEVPGAAVFREYDYYEEQQEIEHCDSVPADECSGDCKACLHMAQVV